MKSSKSKEIVRKKKRVILLLCMIVMLLMLVVGIAIGSLIFNLTNEYSEPQSGNVNTLYIEEELKDKEDSNVLTVELEGKNDENTMSNQNVQNNNTNTVKDKPKEVDAPYYIKVNNQANVVTVYKKDSKRKI